MDTIETLITFGLFLGVLIGVAIVVVRILYRLPSPAYTGPARDRQAAGLLAIFLGTIGAHKWYLRRPWEAILYPLFFWTLVPTVLGVMEGIWYLSLSDEAFRRRVVERRSDGQEIPLPNWFTRQDPDAATGPGPNGMPRGWDLCATCRTLNPADARFCLRCGATIPRRPTGSPDLYTGAHCRACGLPTVIGADHCTDCGVLISPDPASAPAG